MKDKFHPIDSSKESAENVRSDLAFLETFLTGNPSHHDLRRASTRVRELLTHECLLKRVAGPRVGRVSIPVIRWKVKPKFSNLYMSADLGVKISNHVFHYILAYIEGIEEEVIVNFYCKIDNIEDGIARVSKNEAEIEEISLNRFMGERILCFSGEDFKRSEIINFLANKMGGSHHGELESNRQSLLMKARSAFSLDGTGEMIAAKGTVPWMIPDRPNHPINEKRLDILYLILLATIDRTLHSKSVGQLRKLLDEEVRQSG